MVEIEPHVLNSQCFDHHIADKQTIIKEVAVWQKDRNNKDSRINWQFTTKESRVKLKKLYPPSDD